MSNSSSNKPAQELSTRLVGDPKLTVVNKHLWYRVDKVEFPGGHRGNYTYIYDDYAGVATVPLDKRKGRRSVFLILQERYPSKTIGWEVPAGRPEEGETQLEAAKRELQEEAGLEAEYWHPLPRQVENVGRGNCSSDIFIATGITAVSSMADAEEVITDGRWFTMSEVDDLMLAGQISAGHTMASLAVANAFVRRNPYHSISRLVG